MKRPVTRYSTHKELVPLQDKKPTMGLTPSIHDAIPSTMHQVSVHAKDPLDRTDMSRTTRNFDLTEARHEHNGPCDAYKHKKEMKKFMNKVVMLHRLFKLRHL